HLLRGQGRLFEAEPLLRKSLELSEKIASDRPRENQSQRLLGCQLHALASTLHGLGPPAQAEPLLERAITIFDRLAADFPTGPDYRSSQAWAYESKALLMVD